MSEFVLEDAPEFALIPDGTQLEAIVVDAQVRDSNLVDKNDPSKKVQQVAFKFRIEDEQHPEYNGRILFGDTWTTFNNSPNCKLRIWVGEIFGIDELPVGFRLNLEDLIDNAVVVEVTSYEKKDGTRANKVVNLRRIGGYEAALDAF